MKTSWNAGNLGNQSIGGLKGPASGVDRQGRSGKVQPDLFQETLKGLQKPLKSPKSESERQNLIFSNHAVDRMRTRGIRFDENQLNKIEDAVGKARAKGSQETLILADDAALIVNVKNNKVVTVMDQSMMKDNVFTNIDSTVVAL